MVSICEDRKARTRAMVARGDGSGELSIVFVCWLSFCEDKIGPEDVALRDKTGD